MRNQPNDGMTACTKITEALAVRTKLLSPRRWALRNEDYLTICIMPGFTVSLPEMFYDNFVPLAALHWRLRCH